MYYKFRMKERLDGNELLYEEESSSLEELKEKFDFFVTAEKVLSDVLGWETDEWENKRGWFFESYDLKNDEERCTSIELFTVL